MRKSIRKYFVLIILAGLIIAVNAGAQSSKRGLGYGYHSAADLQALGPEISWWYNWYVSPESAVLNVYEDYGFDYVPMTWNGSFNESKLRTFLAAHPQTRYLLAFNEPNFRDQANMTPSQVAAQWPRLEAIADEFGLEIVGPAVNYCGNCVSENGITYSDPVKYLDDFFAACPDCRVDHIAIHCYMNTIGALQWYVGLFKKYGKPIWLTEFAGWESNGNINNAGDQENFLVSAVDYLETEPAVFRYAWFTGRNGGITNYPYIDILAGSGKLTRLGELYKNLPVHDPDTLIQVPARLQAEAYNTMSGILIQKTSDVSGFANVGYIDAGDWLEYGILVPEEGEYNFALRFASTKTSTLNIKVDGSSVLDFNMPNTGGWQKWETGYAVLPLAPGEHKLRLQAVTNGFNINWFQIGDVENLIKNTSPESGLELYPNPGNGVFYLQTAGRPDEIRVFDMTGRLVAATGFREKLDFTFLPDGLYFVRAYHSGMAFPGIEKIIILK